MLSELFHIAKNLAKSGQQAGLVHVDCGEPGLTSHHNLRVLLNDTGEVVSLEPMSDARALSLWTLKKGNFKYFPAIRLSSALLEVQPHEALWDSLRKINAAALRELLTQRFADLRGFAFEAEKEQAARMLQWKDGEPEVLALLHAFAGGFLTLISDQTKFVGQFCQALQRALELPCDEKTLRAYQAVICGVLKESKGKPPKVEIKVQLLLDFFPLGGIEGVLYRPEVRETVLACLNKESAPASGNRRTRTADAAGHVRCALTGESLPLLAGPFADWSAKPIMGKAFKPYSKFSDAECNYRYHLADSAGFPISEDTAKAVVAAGCEATHPKWSGKTWRGMKNGRFEEQNGKKKETSDLLVVFPTFAWADLEPVGIFAKPPKQESKAAGPGDADDEDGLDSATSAAVNFTAVAENYCKALREKVSPESLDRDYIRVLMLRQISPGQVQLVYHAAPSRRHFVESVEVWLASGKNFPQRFRIPVPSKKAPSGIGWFPPRLLFPEEAIRALSHQWMRGGTDSRRVQSPPVGDLLDLFLRREGVWQSTARRLLETLLPRVEPLLTGAGDILHRVDRENTAPWREFSAKNSDGRPDKSKPDPRYSFAQALSLIGTLLHALNSTPDTYMKETAYLTGKLLAIMDEIHRRYCVCERGGAIPPTLIGNGLLGRAADAPLMALDELCERSRIYLAWAKSADPVRAKSDAMRLTIQGAKKLLNLAQPISAGLHSSSDLSQPMNAEGKAHLFLGYLSPVFPAKEKTEGDNEAPDDPEDDEAPDHATPPQS